MPIYKCEKCNKEFPQKSHFTQHTKRKTSCVRGTPSSSASNSLQEPTPTTSPEQSPENSPTPSPRLPEPPEPNEDPPAHMSITTASCDAICRHYDTVLNVDKSTYVSTNDEPTPMKCVKELIDSIPTEFWSPPDLRILDPCCGNGNFGVHIYHKLIEHHNPQTVLQNILEFNDINAQRLDNVREMFDAANHRLQITQHDFLKTAYPTKYDLVVANPPYAKLLENGKRASKNHNLIKDFIQKTLDVLKPDGYLLFITPDNWMSYADRNELIKILTRLQIVRLDIHRAKRYFKKIGSSFTWYLIQNRPAHRNITVSGTWKKTEYMSSVPSIERKYIPLLYTEEVYSILAKTIDRETLPKYRVETSSDLHRYTKQEFIRDVADDVYKHRLIHTPKQTCYASRPHKFQDGYKVFMSTTDKYNVYVDNCGMTQSIVFIRCSCIEEANHIKKILEHPLYVFINNICRWGNFNNIRILQSFPIPHVDIVDENSIYQYFNISDEERRFIAEH